MRLRGLVLFAVGVLALPAGAHARPDGSVAAAGEVTATAAATGGTAKKQAVYGSGLAIPRQCAAARRRVSSSRIRSARSAVLCLINDLRRRAKALPLRASAKLSRAALAHSRDMARRRYFAHTGPGGPTLTQRLRRFRYRPAGAGEAIGMIPNPTPAAIVNAWIRSRSHYRMLVRRSFRYAGVGIVAGRAAKDFPRGVPVATVTVTLGPRR